jgi:hypothetical protein
VNLSLPAQKRIQTPKRRKLWTPDGPVHAPGKLWTPNAEPLRAVTPAYVQPASGNNGGTGDVVTLTFPSHNGLGNFIALIAAFSFVQPTSIVDTNKNTYHLAQYDSIGTAIYYAYNIGGGPNTITATWPSQNFYFVGAAEYTGVQTTTNPLAQTTFAGGSSASANSGNVTTTNANELCIGAVYSAGGSATPTGSWSAARVNYNFGQDILFDQVLLYPAAVAATASVTSGTWSALIATFFAMVGAPNDAMFFGMNF